MTILMLRKDISNNNNIISNNLISKIDQTPKIIHIMFIIIVEHMEDISNSRCSDKILQCIPMPEWEIIVSGEILFMLVIINFKSRVENLIINPWAGDRKSSIRCL
jgi:hypothetical protein